jgi:hypothetical protein
MCGWIGKGSFASSPARAMSFLAVAGVIGPPRSVTNKYGVSGPPCQCDVRHLTSTI